MISAERLTAARARAGQVLTSTVTVEVPGAAPTWDPTTGVLTPATPTVRYTGAGSIRAAKARTRTAAQAGDTVLIEGWVLAVPHTAPALPPGAHVTIAAPGALADLDTPADLWVAGVDTTGTVGVLRRYRLTTVQPGSEVDR